MLPVNRPLALAVAATALGACVEAEAPREAPTSSVAHAETPACSQSCPDGARVATFKTSASEIALDTFGGAFLYVKNGCETYCEPLTRCLAPNVPVVSNGAFQCQLLPGYTKLEDPANVDLSFGSLWDETKVTP